MQLLLLLLAAGATAVPHVGHSDHGSQQFTAPEPGGYSFGYNHAHGEGGGASWRKESADAAGNVIGSYGFKDPDGRVRLVTYVANQDGFQANVQSNEPGLPQHNLGLGAGITQWPIPQRHAHVHHAGAHAGTVGTGPHHGSWSTSPPVGPPVALRHADAPVGAPYSFSYDSSAIGGPFQQEAGDALGSKRGSYGLSGRRVNYVADAGGFRASVQSNEPGVDNTKSPADVVFTGSPTSAGPPPSASSGRQEDGDSGLVYPPPYPGGSGASGSGAPGYGTEDGSGAVDDDDFRPSVESNEPGFDGAQNPADVDVYKRPGPVGIALVFSGPPGSAPAGAALIPPPGLGIEGRRLPVGPTGIGFPASPGAAGPVYTGYGQQGGAGVYNFAYGNGRVVGPRQQESGDDAGNNEGSYGLTVDDGRFRTVNYAAGTNGFRTNVDTNEPGADGAQSPAGDAINKSPEPAGTVPASGSSGFNGASTPTGSGGFPGVQGQVIPAAHLRPALIGQPGVLLVPGSAGYPGVQRQAFVPVGSASPASSGLPAVSVVPGSYGFNVIHSYTAGAGAPGLNLPVSTSNTVLPSPVLGPAGGYSGGPGYAFHREGGDPSGTKSGGYGFNGNAGAFRTLNYATDGTGFRASVQSNEPGVHTPQNPADVSINAPRGVALITAPDSQAPNTPLARHHIVRGGH
uniref:Structural constituent of cuticle n=1 Tax=Rhipicephalus zambeziensis TaxID=60191 RepID=A0A224Z044_9ACAR